MSPGKAIRATSLIAQFLVIILAGCAGFPPDTREAEPIAGERPIAPTVPGTVAAPELPTPVPMSPPRPSPIEPATPPAVPTADGIFEQQKRQDAEKLMQSGRWTEAADQWEILTLLRPSRAEYAEALTKARNRAVSQASESLAAAAQAHDGNDLQSAASLYLRTLMADPHNVAAAQALRELERKQSHRSYFNHAAIGGKSKRTKRAARTVNKSTSDVNLDSEVGTASKELAKVYYEQGLRMQSSDLKTAIQLFERSLDYDPNHAQAKIQLDKARRMQQSLNSTPEGNSKP